MRSTRAATPAVSSVCPAPSMTSGRSNRMPCALGSRSRTAERNEPCEPPTSTTFFAPANEYAASTACMAMADMPLMASAKWFPSSVFFL